MNCESWEAKTALACVQGIFLGEKERSKWKRHPVRIVTLESLANNDLSNAVFLWLNRESHASQKENHAPKTAAQFEAYTNLSIAGPFLEDHITASGNLNALLGKSIYALVYFIWLEEKIREGLEMATPGKTLYIVFCTKARLMRPTGFDKHDKKTWDYTKTDFELFVCWFNYCFGSRSKDIIFVMLHIGTPAEDRGFETRLSMIYKKKMGGRPAGRKRSGSKGKKYFKKFLLEPAVWLAKFEGLNARQVMARLKEEYAITIPERTVQSWLNENGCSSPRGRPKGSTKKKRPFATDYSSDVNKSQHFPKNVITHEEKHCISKG